MVKEVGHLQVTLFGCVTVILPDRYVIQVLFFLTPFKTKKDITVYALNLSSILNILVQQFQMSYARGWCRRSSRTLQTLPKPFSCTGL